MLPAKDLMSNNFYITFHIWSQKFEWLMLFDVNNTQILFIYQYNYSQK